MSRNIRISEELYVKLNELRVMHKVSSIQALLWVYANKDYHYMKHRETGSLEYSSED